MYGCCRIREKNATSVAPESQPEKKVVSLEVHEQLVTQFKELETRINKLKSSEESKTHQNRHLSLRVDEIAKHLEKTNSEVGQLTDKFKKVERRFKAMEECGLFNQRKYYIGCLFGFIDEDLSGYIDSAELTLFLANVQAQDVHTRLVSKIIAQYDVDNNHQLDREEFESFITAILSLSFQKLDEKANGELTMKDCEKLVDLALGENKKNDPNPNETVFNLMNVDKESKNIDKDEFIDFVLGKLVNAQQFAGKDTLFMASAVGKIVKFNTTDLKKLAGIEKINQRVKKNESESSGSPKYERIPSVQFSNNSLELKNASK